MAKQISDKSTPLAVSGEAKAPWHAPVFKRLDVDLTAGNKRNSNDAPTGENHFLNS